MNNILESAEKIKSNEKAYRIVRLIPWLCLVIAFICYCCFIGIHSEQLLDADMSSEIVLANLLANEHRIVSPNWFYSTALNVVNSNLVYTPFFWISNNWHVVRVCSSIVMMILMLASYYYLCRQLGIARYYPLSAILLVVPFSNIYFDNVMQGMYYTPHITFSFVLLGAAFHYRNCEKNSAKSKIILVLSFVFAALIGLGGLRPLLITAMPLMAVAVFSFFMEISGKSFFADESKENMESESNKYDFALAISGIVITIGCLVGYVINAFILSKIYHFSTQGNKYGTVKWTDMNEYFSDILMGIFRNFGYKAGDELMSTAVIHNAMSFVLVFLVVAYVVIIFKHRSEHSAEAFYLSIFFVFGVAFCLVLYLFTSMIYMDRYLLTNVIFYVPLVAMSSYDNALKNSNDAVKTSYSVIAVLVFAGVMLCSLINYRDYYRTDSTKDYRDMIAAVSAEGYADGFASFWNANVVTELSDGRIDMYAWDDDINVILDGGAYEWLQKVSHATTRPAGKVFLLLEQGVYVGNRMFEDIPAENKIYESGYTIAFGFDSFDAMCAAINRD